MSKQDISASRTKAQGPRPGQPARGTRTGRPLLVAFDLLGRRWALRVLWELRQDSVGFRALQQRCEGMSSSVLRDRLAELTGAGLLETDSAGRYGLSSHGRALLQALEPLSRWADEWGSAVADLRHTLMTETPNRSASRPPNSIRPPKVRR